MVTICPGRSLFILSIIQVRVVDFPLPAAPVTRIMPFWFSASDNMLSGI